MSEILIDGRTMTTRSLWEIAQGHPVGLSDEARRRMSEGAMAYALNRPTGILRQKWAWLGAGPAPDDEDLLVRRFIEGHCAAVGDPLPIMTVRATLAVRANVLATGHTGARPEVAQLLIEMLNADVVPLVPTFGSVGAAAPSPLAHIVRVAQRYGGMAWRRGEILPAEEAMRGLPEVSLTQKEALSLINGESLGAAMAALACERARRLLRSAESACALSFEVVKADRGCLAVEALRARGHQGAVDVAERLVAGTAGSELVGIGRDPDPFSVRCAPTVLGAAWDALIHTDKIVSTELNGACDNPVVIPGFGVFEAGNFHGAPIGLAMDHLKIAMTQVASISERRTFRLTHGQLSGLPSFLLASNGLNNGLMLAQYTAASLVSECKGLSHPASVDSIPTVQHREDHVSMSTIAARGALHILDLLADVVAIELLCGAQGLDFHLAGEAVDGAGQVVAAPVGHPGVGSRRVFDAVRALVPRWTDDRVLHPDLMALSVAVKSGSFAFLLEKV